MPSFVTDRPIPNSSILENNKSLSGNPEGLNEDPSQCEILTPINEHKIVNFVASTSSSSRNGENGMAHGQILIPEHIRLFPKVVPRKCGPINSINTGRKKMYSAILMDTPERNKLEKEKIFRSSQLRKTKASALKK